MWHLQISLNISTGFVFVASGGQKEAILRSIHGHAKTIESAMGLGINRVLIVFRG